MTRNQHGGTSAGKETVLETRFLVGTDYSVADRIMVLYGGKEKNNLLEEKQLGIPLLCGGQFHCGID